MGSSYRWKTSVRGSEPGRPMSVPFEDRLQALGLELPEPSRPGAGYVQFVQTGNLVFSEKPAATPAWRSE